MRRPRPPPGASTARALAVGTTGGRSLLGRQRLLHDLLRLVSNFSAKLRTAVVDRASALRTSVVTVGVATPKTATEETVEAEEARLVEEAVREPVRLSDEVAGAVAAALGEAAVVDETARGVVPLVTVPLSARPRFQARTAARSLW